MTVAFVKPSALIVLPEAPYPVAGGGPLRSASIIEFLASRYRLSAIHFRLSGDPDPAELYPRGFLHSSWALDLPHHSKEILPKLQRNLIRALRGVPPLVDRFAGHEDSIARFLAGRHFDLIWVEHFWAAPYARLLRKHATKLVLDLHNIESQYFLSMSVDSPASHRPLLRHFAQRSQVLEKELFPCFDLIVTASEADRRRTGAPAQCAVLPNTIPFHSLPDTAKSNSIVFSGNFAYQPNQQGLSWFARDCWPRIRKALPYVQLRLVGKEISYARRVFREAGGVEFVGPVDDAVLEIGKSQLAIVPLLSGSGTRLKILEAWAAGTPVVSTPLGAEGLDVNEGEHVKIAADAAGFSRTTVALFGNKEELAQFAKAGRSLYESNYTWRTAHRILSELEL